MYLNWKMRDAVQNWEQLNLREVDALLRQMAGRCRRASDGLKSLFYDSREHTQPHLVKVKEVR